MTHRFVGKETRTGPLRSVLEAATDRMPAMISTRDSGIARRRPSQPRPQLNLIVGKKRSRRLRRAYSFIGGALIGISLSLPVLVLNAGDDYGELVLLTSLILASTGIGMHFNGSRRTVRRIMESLAPFHS